MAFDWDAWARSDPELDEELRAYRQADFVDGIAILERMP